MTAILVGLFFILFSYNVEFMSQNLGSMVTVDIIPDFVGFLILWFALEKKESVNRWFKESLTLTTGLLVISFLVFASQLQFLFSSWLQDIDSKAIALIITVATLAFQYGECIIYALTMIFMVFLSRAFMYEADRNRLRGYSVAFTVFFFVYLLLTAAFVVLQFIKLPFSFYLIALPVNIAFMALLLLSSRKIDILGNI